MEKNNRDESVRKEWEDERQKRGSSDTNNDSSNEPYLADGDTTIRKKDPNHSPDWREDVAPNPSNETSGWQRSNEDDDAIREPEGTFTTGERGNVINSATWDPENHTSEEDVEHVDVNDYDKTASPRNHKDKDK
ncbi:hypothetical protein [Planococcus salinus]|uniref:Uncharacterized protein n=1 Tax=Planococcus salinus TaxID=1848460 RepID=A0A3M8P5F3_9BACL|nr:hypothetical protein [Planococcus salinus]RNF38885.1 hypothetical protein EEX84_12255 [Planococcus salinus]